MNQDPSIQLTNLDSSTIPLTGRHLIEASAGTGKTYNITRIYLRLLLERELKVEEILLMTFTKDATQELRGRIDAFLREALNNWETLCIHDSYFKAINDRVSFKQVEFLLKRALLFLDEAAIFTIHGFCQRALSQHAFTSGLPFNANMTTNSNELVIEATQDWYRQLAKQNTENFDLIVEFWPTPNTFLSSFAKAISHTSLLSLMEVNNIVTNFVLKAKCALKTLDSNTSLLDEGLISHKKVEEQEKRVQELVNLKNWLSNISACENEHELLLAIKQPMPDYLLNGNRHPKAFKPQLANVLTVTKEVKLVVKDLAKKINKAKAYQIVRDGIYVIREQVKLKKEQLNCLDFDDIINTLADCLQSPIVTSDQNKLAQTLLAQYPVALVDEFQDTDPQQFSILQAIYYQNNDAIEIKDACALYLIGDPKQAIYGFRGGDIFAYLNARADCDYHWLMDTNWRSSPDVIEAYNKVFTLCEDDAAHKTVFGYGIDYQAVLAGKKSNQVFSSDANSGSALQFIHFTSKDENDKVPQSNRSLLATWCANEIITLLNAPNDNPSVNPKDIAILVRDGREATDIKNALSQAKLASVFLSDRTNLFESEQASQLLQLLKGILSSEDERLYLCALTCGLLGYNAAKLYELQQDEYAYQTLKFSFQKYREQWQRQGFIAMAMNILHQEFDFSQSHVDNARPLTNLLHLFEMLQTASQRFLQPQELIYWFEQQCNEATNINNDLETEQRLESEGDLIRIVTQHGAKGLEYPVVFIPFATRHKDPLKFGNKSVNYLEYHNDQGQLCLSLDGDEQAKDSMANEAYAESIRLLYVAITRAESRCYILTTAFEKYAFSPLGKTLKWQPEQNIANSLQTLVKRSPKAMSLQQVSFDELSSNEYIPFENEQSKTTDLTPLRASKFIGKIERDWWLSSFSALSKNLRHGGVSTPDRDSAELIGQFGSAEKKENLLRFHLAKGAHSGNLMHDILEQCNFLSSNTCNNNLLESIKWPLVKYGELAPGFTQEDLINWLDEIVSSPLHSSDDHNNTFSLSKISLQKTLRESEFYFPMEQANIQDLEKLLTDHRNINRKKNYRNVRLPSYKSLKGMMHGFIDLVFEYEGKFYVCDYKSSHLGEHFDDYNQDALRENIEHNYYDLQYLIYSLALHRYLKGKLENYSIAEHFGGIFYLYLRGMTSNPAFQGKGVYYRHIGEREISLLDAIFTGNTHKQELVNKSSIAAEKEQE